MIIGPEGISEDDDLAPDETPAVITEMGRATLGKE
jgi:hypothetical protein